MTTTRSTHSRVVVVREPGGDGPHVHTYTETCPGTFGDPAAIGRAREVLEETERRPLEFWRGVGERHGYTAESVREFNLDRARTRLRRLERGACPVCDGERYSRPRRRTR